jgi:methyl-accepting chemotaxis protein
MSINEQITAAIGAHGLWKSRLRAAIAKGASDVPLETVRNDHVCSFGKWLYGPEIEAATKTSAHYKTCAEIHHRFHVAAAGVISLVISGNNQEASRAMEGACEFDKVSRELTRALLAWKDA